ncbi:hypothetical protein [Haloparvum sedimenti]|uniref:hypothetical protein n=1 Tax=Haloparvum sedimenti TaxID=1678448 RepID=UPI00071E96E2|nr:hypothetical protein [Haloparvum sedimenti]
MNPKQQLIRRVIDNNQEEIRRAAGQLADVEAEQRAAVRDLCDALDVDPEAVGAPPTLDREDRVDQLEAMIGARLAGNPWALYVDEVAPETLTDADDAAQYAGMDPEDWQAQIESWADYYREQGMEGTDRELAAGHVSAKFGVDLDTFEDEIVAWTPTATYERLFRAPSDRTTAALRELVEQA